MRLAQSGIVAPYPELTKYVTREMGLPQQEQKSEARSQKSESSPSEDGLQSEEESEFAAEE